MTIRNPFNLAKGEDGQLYEQTGLALIKNKTNRGFEYYKFADKSGANCSLQESSLATESAIWFGVDDCWPKAFFPKGTKNPDHGVWEEMSRERPEGASSTLCGSRMHLTQEQLKTLLPTLQFFAEHGRLPNTEE